MRDFASSIVAVLCITVALLGRRTAGIVRENLEERTAHELHRLEPIFDETTPRNVTTAVGKTVYLPCRVRYLGDRTVSERTFNCMPPRVHWADHRHERLRSSFACPVLIHGIAAGKRHNSRDICDEKQVQ